MVPSLRDPSANPMLPPSRRTLEARIEDLTQALDRLEARVQRLEGYGGAPRPADLAPPEAIHATAPGREEHGSLASVLGMVGQVCLILGGAFLLRTLTDGGTVARPAGMALGLAYAITWALVAWRTTSTLHAAFYGLASILITYPLLWESTTTFAILRAPAAALLLLLAACLHIGVAWIRSLRTIAWVAILSVLAAAFGLMVATQSIEWFVALFLALGAGSLWLTYGRRWHALRWPAALAADLAVLVLTVLAAWPGGPPEGYRGLSPERSMALALGLVVIYLGSFATRMLQRRRTLNTFEMVQTALVLLAGFGGALRVALASGSGAGLLGGGVLVAGIGCGAAAYPFLADQEDLRANFSFFTTLALVFLLLGGPIVLPRAAFALAAGFLGLAATALGLRFRRTVLVLHGTVSLTAGALASGLLAQAVAAFLGPAAGLARPSAPALALLAFLAAAHALLVTRRPAGPLSWRFRVPSLLLGMQAILGLGALAVWALFRLTRGGADPGLLAAIRTGALSTAAIGLAALGRRHPASELRWLVYPLLALAALKFLFEDLPGGRPLTWFLAFMVYGAALILAPRFLKAAHPKADPPPPGNM
ncbi:hypothetical protein GETHPA_01250 [Geothrix rubra]|uniref:DUF2339 domain-containing protein n=1 Tax=Geothrix rubra TaxID=2927977 RepID=A0ABQ5Q1R5_9BACT|nr:hypothetical protein [Geothrix rubra]GLH68592.1 hypothetical protein GETHPA_01250 [Geothrix rubra]